MAEWGLDERLQPAAHAPARAHEDAQAALRRWADFGLLDAHSARSTQRFLTSAVIERARCEVLSMHDLPGMAINLADATTLAPRADSLKALYLQARSLIEARAHADGVAVLTEASRVHRWFDGAVDDTRPLVCGDLARDDSASGDEPEDEGVPTATPPSGAHGVSPTATGRHQAEPGPDASPEAWAKVAKWASSAHVPQGTSDSPGQAPGGVSSEARAGAGYAVFSKAFDQEISASALAREKRFEAAVGPAHTSRALARALRRLHRSIHNVHRWHWQFGLPAGQLDPRRLSKLVSTNPPFDIFRTRTPEGEGVAVCCLVDQSGSMKGQSQELAVMSVRLIAEQLERAGVPFEVLSFTTRYGGRDDADNPIYRRWLDLGQPAHPGRLNALCHIVIKPFQDAWRARAPDLGVVLAPSVGKENIDGEAVHWAAKRLSRRLETHKLLIVFSDGCPKDPSTDHANPPLFLDNHLRAVIQDIERSTVTLMGLGVGPGSAHFYPIADNIDRIDELPERVLNSVAGVFETMRAGQVRR